MEGKKKYNLKNETSNVAYELHCALVWGWSDSKLIFTDFKSRETLETHSME